MKPIKVLELTEVDRLKLEKGYYNGPTHKYRIRLQIHIAEVRWEISLPDSRAIRGNRTNSILMDKTL